MKYKKIIATISAAAMLITSAITATADTAVEGKRFPFPLESYVDENIKTSSTYTVEGAKNVVYSFTFDSVGWADAKVRNGDGSDGNRSLRIRGTGTTSRSRGLGAEFTVKFGNPTADGKYVISFDLYRELSSDYDYATLNYDGWDGPARLTGTTKWAVTELGAGNSIGGVGTGSWSRYTATLLTFADDPQLNFAVANGGELHIDNIIVKDTQGNVLFAESFESSGPIIAVPEADEEPEEPDVDDGTRFPFPLEGLVDENIKTASTYTVEGTENVVYRFTFEDKGSPDAKVRTADASDGTRSMRIRGSYTTSKSRGLGAEFTIKFGNPTADGKYVISFDLYRELSSDYDYATLNYDGWDGPARLTGTTKWTVTPLGAGNSIGGTGTGNWSRYTATLSTIADDPQLNFAVANGGELHIDNIIVKDTSGNVLYAESFEADGPIIAVPEEEEKPASTIYDAEVMVVNKVGDSYEVVGTADKLTADTLLMTSVKIENASDPNPVSANVYTALYKNEKELVYVDAQTVTAVTGGEMTSGAVIRVPSLDDGVYTLRVFVWDDEMCPIKDVKSLGE